MEVLMLTVMAAGSLLCYSASCEQTWLMSNAHFTAAAAARLRQQHQLRTNSNFISLYNIYYKLFYIRMPEVVILNT